MRMQLRSFVAVMALFCAGSMAGATDIYVLTNGSSNFTASQNTDFGRIDTVTGNYTSITNLGGGIGNLAWNPNAGNFFVTKYNSGSYELRTLSTTGTLSDSLGSFGNRAIYGMAYRTTNSTLYAYDFSNDFTGTLDPTNGAWTTLNTSPGTRAYDPQGGHYTMMGNTMYFALNNNSNGAIGTMGYTASSGFQQLASNSLYSYMNLASDDTVLYGLFGSSTTNQKLYTINPADGTLTAGPSITGAGLGKYFKGASIATVPEPSTWALGAIATGVMAAVTRRRKADKA